MKIAVNARFLIKDKLEGIGWYTHELVRRMAAAHPEAEFHLLFDRAHHGHFDYGSNVTSHVLYPSARHPLLWYAWFELAVPLALRRIKPDVFFSPDNFLSLRTQVPTVMTCHDLLPFTWPQAIPNLARRYYQHFWPKYLHSAKQVISVSDTTKHEAERLFGLERSKITTVYNGCRAGFAPAQGGEQLSGVLLERLLLTLRSAQGQISQYHSAHGRQALASGYFLAAGSIHPRKNIVQLIAAFDLFKRQTSLPHQLVLAGRMAWQSTDVAAALEASAYRSDIILTGYLTDADLQDLTRHATCAVYVSLAEGFGLPIIEAMQSGVPVITSNTSCMPEVAGGAALLVQPTNTEAIAWAMHKIATDVVTRNQLIDKGLQRARAFDWDVAAEQTWRVLSHVAAASAADLQAQRASK